LAHISFIEGVIFKPTLAVFEFLYMPNSPHFSFTTARTLLVTAQFSELHILSKRTEGELAEKTSVVAS